MGLFIDGIIFSLQRYGGISVYFRELLAYFEKERFSPGMELDITLGLETPVTQADFDFLKRSLVDIRCARTQERYRSCRVPCNARIFHSSYYRVPQRSSVPSVVTVHDFVYERFRTGPGRWVHSFQKNSAIRQGQALICISESTKEDLLEYVGVRPEQVVHVIPNGVSRAFHPISVNVASRPFILFIGERGGYKNFSLAVKALQFLPDLELHCVGGSKLSRQEFSGLSFDVCRRVKHLGFLTEKELNIAYNQALCLLYPSKYEGFGIPVAEAMRAGCPVVSINCKAVVEVGGAAIQQAQEEDPKAVADAILSLLERSYRQEKINLGLERAKLYDWSRTHDQTLQVYRSFF